MTESARDQDWLRVEVTRLFQDAAARNEPDHQACVKYAELLFKLLPKDGRPALQSQVEAVRKAVFEGKKKPASDSVVPNEEPPAGAP